MDELVGGAAVRPERLLGLRRPARQQRPRLATQLQRQTNLQQGKVIRIKGYCMVLILENVALRTNFTLHVRTYSELPYNISTMDIETIP